MAHEKSLRLRRDELYLEKDIKNHHFIYNPSVQITLADVTILILILLVFGKNRPRRRYKNGLHLGDSASKNTENIQGRTMDEKQVNSSPDLSTFTQLPLALLGLNSDEVTGKLNDEKDKMVKDNDMLEGHDDTLESFDDKENMFLEEDDDDDNDEIFTDFDIGKDIINTEKEIISEESTSMVEYSLLDFNIDRNDFMENRSYSPAPLPACIKGSYKGAKVSAMLPGACQITGEVVFNFDHIIALKVDGKIIFVNEDAIAWFC